MLSLVEHEKRVITSGPGFGVFSKKMLPCFLLTHIHTYGKRRKTCNCLDINERYEILIRP